jgi:hypothetical protein
MEAENAKARVANKNVNANANANAKQNDAKQNELLNDSQHLYITIYIFIHPLCKP